MGIEWYKEGIAIKTELGDFIDAHVSNGRVVIQVIDCTGENALIMLTQKEASNLGACINEIAARAHGER